MMRLMRLLVLEEILSSLISRVNNFIRGTTELNLFLPSLFKFLLRSMISRFCRKPNWLLPTT